MHITDYWHVDLELAHRVQQWRRTELFFTSLLSWSIVSVSVTLCHAITCPFSEFYDRQHGSRRALSVEHTRQRLRQRALTSKIRHLLKKRQKTRLQPVGFSPKMSFTLMNRTL